MTPKKMRAIACCLDYLIREQSELNCRTDLRAAGPRARPTNRKCKCVPQGLILSSSAPQPIRFRGVKQGHVFSKSEAANGEIQGLNAQLPVGESQITHHARWS
jgi:hypothetical protein